MKQLMHKQQVWHATLERLRSSIHSAAFTTCLQGTIALSWQEEVFVMGVSTTFAKAQLEVRYLEQINTTLSEIAGTPLRVQLVVSPDLLLRDDLLPKQPEGGWHESTIATFLVFIAKEAFHYIASVPDIPGCIAIGETRQEAVQNVREALQTYVDIIDNDHASVPEPQTTTEYIHLPLSLNREQRGNRALQSTVSTTVNSSCCSFCQKQQDQVVHLTNGPGGVHICNECVEYCREMIENGTADFQQLKQALASRRHEMI